VRAYGACLHLLPSPPDVLVVDDLAALGGGGGGGRRAFGMGGGAIWEAAPGAARPRSGWRRLRAASRSAARSALAGGGRSRFTPPGARVPAPRRPCRRLARAQARGRARRARVRGDQGAGGAGGRHRPRQARAAGVFFSGLAPARRSRAPRRARFRRRVALRAGLAACLPPPSEARRASLAVDPRESPGHACQLFVSDTAAEDGPRSHYLLARWFHAVVTLAGAAGSAARSPPRPNLSPRLPATHRGPAAARGTRGHPPAGGGGANSPSGPNACCLALALAAPRAGPPQARRPAR
jgi:hypothetical protein